MSSGSPAAALPPPPWPVIHQNTERTGYIGVDSVTTNPKPAWQFNRSGGPSRLGAVHSPVIANGSVYLVTDPNPSDPPDGPLRSGVLGLNATTGAVNWQLATGASTDFIEDAKGPAAVGPDGTVYVAFSNCLVALDGAAGTVKWKFPRYPDPVHPVASECNLPARTGTVPLLGAFSDGPTVAPDGTIWVPSGQGFMLQINPPVGPGAPTLADSFQTAPKLATAGCDRDLRSMPAMTAVTGGYDVYFGSDDPDGKLWRVAERTGFAAVVSSAAVDPSVGPPANCAGPPMHDTNSTPAIDTTRGRVFIGSDDGKLHAFDRSAVPQLIWSSVVGRQTDNINDLGPEDSIPAINPSDGTVVVGSGDGNVYAVNADGTSKWARSECGGAVVESSAAISSNGIAYIGTNCGLLGYYVATGESAFHYSDDNVEFSPAIGPDGTLYYPTDKLITTPANDEESMLTALVPTPSSAFHPVVPARLLDSRTPTGGWPGPLLAGSARALTVTGVGTVPLTASAVIMNVTATQSSSGSFLTVYPKGTAAPNASNLNFAAGETIPNLVTVRVGTAGQVMFATAVGSTDVVADVVGYFDDGTGPGDLYTGITPFRLLDSRGPNGGWNAKIASGDANTRVLQVSGRGTVPASATAAIINVTATDSDSGSFLQVWPTNASRPNSSNLNFAGGQTIANLVTVQLSPSGQVSFYNNVGNTHVVADVVGYFEPSTGSRFHPLSGPKRFLDSRLNLGLPGPWSGPQTRALGVTAAHGIPAGATGLIMNTTVTEGTQGSFVTVFPDGASLPTSSNVNFGPGQTIPNLAITQLPPNGTIKIYNQLGSVQIIADATGYFALT